MMMIDIMKMSALLKPVCAVLLEIEDGTKDEEIQRAYFALVSAAEKLGYTRAEFTAFLKKLAGN